MPIYNGRTRISDENIWRVVDIKTTTVTSALYENLEENIREDLQIGDFVLEITEVNQYISDDDILDNKINNINIPNGEIRKTYAVILSKENYNKLQYLTGFTTNTSYSTLGSLRNDINNLKANIVYLIRNDDKYDEYILTGSGNNKELVKIGDTSITFDSSNLVDVSEFLQLRTDLKQSHDELNNRISSNATNISKNANNIQNLTNETLSIKNNLNNVEADMTTVKKEVWGSNTTTGDSRIDILEETTQKKERTEIDYLNMGTTTDPGYYNVVNQNGNGFSITYKTSENGASSTIENITKAPMDVYSAILNGVSYVIQRIIIGDKTYTRYLNVSSNTTSPWMAEPVVTNTITNTPNKIPTNQAVINYVPNPSSTTPSADTTSGSVGTGTTWARSNHTHPKSSLYAEANHTHGNITNDGKIGTSNNSNKNVVTDANGNITIEDKELGGIELIETTNTSDEELAATSTTLSEVKDGTMILLKVINPFTRISADCALTLTLKNGGVFGGKLINHPDSPTGILHSNIVPPNTIFLMRYNGLRWDIIDQHNLATQSFRGLMSAEDKTKLDNVSTNANQVNIDTSLSETSTNPVQNKVIKAALDTKADIGSIPSLTQFKCHGTPGSNGYIKVFQIKINTTYQDSPISFSLMQRGTKQSAMVNIRFANENSNDPTLDSFTFNGNNIGNNGEYYLYKESASTWSFIVRKWDAHDVINIYNMNTTNGGVAITSLDTQVSELPSGCIPASMIRNDLFFKTKNGSTSNYMNLFEIRPTGNYQSKPITFEIVRQTKPTPVYVSVRLTNVTLESNTYAPQTIWSWGTSDTPVYIRKEENNVFNVIMYHLANEEISVCNMNNPNQSVKITPLGTVYGTDVPVTSGDNQVWKDTYTVGGTTFGTGTNNVVRGNDSRLSDTRNPKSTKINANSDLNTYTTTGFYYNNANSDCATITPLPQPNKAFFLQVEDWGTSNYTKQTITHYDPVKTYERIRNTRTWTDWYELQHNDGTGGENLLRTEPNNEGNSGVAYTITDETFHNDKVYYRNETSKDTTKYSGWTWTIPKTEFDYGDVFTLSFYAKGTTDAEIRTYFAGASGYISNRRLSSNSDVDGDRVIGSYGDGATRFHLTSDWKRYYVTYQLHTTATTPTQNKSIHIRTLGASTDIEFYISNVKLERGYYATDYDRRTKDNEPLYFPTEVSLPSTATTELRRKFIHPPYKFKNIPNWTVEGELKVTGDSARFELHKADDTNIKNFIALGKNGSGNLAYWWGTSSSAESSKTYSASDIEVDTWYPFRISRMGDNVLFMFNNDYKHEVTTTYFNTFEYIEPSIFGYGTSGASVRNLKITPLEPVHPLSPNSSVCTNAQGIITTESKNNHTHSDTQLNWNGDTTNNSISPLLMATESEFGANRLAYFPSSRIKVEYSTDGGSTWNELTTGNYSEENKTKLVTTASQYMFLGNNSTTDYSKNSLRITFNIGDMNADSILYLVTRKIALFTGTANSTGFTCRIQTQTYAQYNTNSETFSNYGSAFTLGGWSGWNTAPLDIILGGYKSSNQTNSSSERIKALRLLFTQTGGTGNGFVAKVRLYGETAHKTASQYANNNHIYTINENQDATFPSKIIKEGGTSSQFLMANGDVQNKVTSWSNTPSDVNIPSEKLVKTEINSIQETIGSNSPQIMKVEYIERQYQNTSGRQLVIQVTCDVPITRGNIVANSNDGANTSIKTLSGSDNMMICTFGIYDANESDTFNITLKNNNGVITDTYSFSYTFSGNNNYWVDTGYVNNSYSIRNEIDSLKNGLANILQYKKVASFQDNKIRVFANSFSVCILINGAFTVAANNIATLCTIPSQYRPPNAITLPCIENQTVHNYISIWSNDGKVNLRNRGSETSVTAYNIAYYPLRDTIGV